MSEYFRKNENSQISKIIFSIRSKKIDITVCQEWKYHDHAFFACYVHEENMEHFLWCQAYENCPQEK